MYIQYNKFKNDYSKTIDNLAEVLKLEKNEFVRDSAVKRFEICFDLAWKTIKAYLKTQNVECYSPKGCFREAYQNQLIGYDYQWLKMVDDRNLCAHLYSLEQADQIYEKLGEYLKMFESLLKKLESL